MKARLLEVIVLATLLVWSDRMNLARAETFQLTPVDRKEEADQITRRSTDELRDTESGKEFIIKFVGKSDWEAKYKLTSSRFRKAHKSAESLRSAFNKESYFRIDFVKTQFVDKGTSKNLTVRANLYWFLEGYEGVQTYYFILLKQKDGWVLDWLIY